MTKQQADDLAAANSKLHAWYRDGWVYFAVGLIGFSGGVYLMKK